MVRRIRTSGRNDRSAFDEVDTILHKRYKVGQDIRARVVKYKVDRGTQVIDLTLLGVDDAANGAADNEATGNGEADHGIVVKVEGNTGTETAAKGTPPSATPTEVTHFSAENGKAAAVQHDQKAHGQDDTPAPNRDTELTPVSGKGQVSTMPETTPSEQLSAVPSRKPEKIEGALVDTCETLQLN